jgi:hypothetical protein
MVEAPRLIASDINRQVVHSIWQSLELSARQSCQRLDIARQSDKLGVYG